MKKQFWFEAGMLEYKDGIRFFPMCRVGIRINYEITLFYYVEAEAVDHLRVLYNADGWEEVKQEETSSSH